MVLDFTKEEKNQIINMVDEWSNIADEIEQLQNSAKEIQEKVDSKIKRMDELKKEETELMKSLHEKYGNFSLQDIRDSINE